MANTEQTHAKNLDNCRAAISIGQSVGGIYLPSNSLIDLTKLQTFADGFAAVMQAVNDALPAEENAIDAQMAAFKLVSKRVTKILNAAKGQDLPTESLATLRTTANSIRGIRVSKKIADDPATPEDESKKSVSASRRSYAGILEALDLMLEQLKSMPLYNPNETEYKITTLDAWIGDLNALHQTAISAKAPVRGARNARNAFAYNDIDGLIVRMKVMKNYVRSILPTTDTRYIQLNRLAFVNLG